MGPKLRHPSQVLLRQRLPHDAGTDGRMGGTGDAAGGAGLSGGAPKEASRGDTPKEASAILGKRQI